MHNTNYFSFHIVYNISDTVPLNKDIAIIF